MTNAVKNCPLCGKEILAAAIKCKHCKGDLPTSASASSLQPATETRIIGKISKKANKITAENMSPGEITFFKIQGLSGDTLVVTSNKVLIVKTGLGAIAIGTLGSSVKTFALDMITGVDQKKGMMSGHIEFTVPGVAENKSGGFLNAAASENVFQYEKQYHDEIVQAVNRIRELSQQARQPKAAPAPAPAPQEQDDIPAQIRKLAELKAQEILTEEEFVEKKKELLSRM